MNKILLPSLLLSACVAPCFALSTEAIHEAHAFDPRGVVELVNVNGNIEISAWNQNEVSIEAEKTADTDEDLKLIDVKIEATATKLSVTTHFPKDFPSNHISSVTYKLHVPATARLAKIKSVNSNITVTGIQGGVSCETVNGSVNVFGTSNHTSLSTVNGAIFAQTNFLPDAAHVILKTVNGQCKFEFTDAVNATVTAHTLNGHIDYAGVNPAGRKRENSLNTTLGSGGATIALSTVNGGITLTKS